MKTAVYILFYIFLLFMFGFIIWILIQTVQVYAEIGEILRSLP